LRLELLMINLARRERDECDFHHSHHGFRCLPAMFNESVPPRTG
jgi:hypothetical protein